MKDGRSRRGLSPRTRFEILKRAGFRCRYCGRPAPDVELVVDHITPVALGGTDDPVNLCAACGECNGGKAAVPLDVDALADRGKAMAWPSPDARYAFPDGDDSEGPPIILSLDDDFLRALWSERRPRSKWEAAFDLVARTESGGSRSVPDLARAWSWTTGNVVRFIRKATERGALEVRG